MDDSITKKPPYGIITILMVGAFISFLNNTFLNVALPSIMKDLDVKMSTVQWLTTGFMLVNGIMIPTTAFLIQKYSVRRLFLTAVGLFTAGTIVGAIAPTFSILLLARMTQASGSAILMPLLMNVLLVSFPVSRRGAAMGTLGLILTFAPAIGPTLSGWIVEHFNWRALFYLIAPIAGAVWIFGFMMLRDKKEKVDIHLDFLSLVLSTFGFGGLLYGFSTAGNSGWNHVQVYATLTVGVVSLFIFILRQSKLEQPMLNFRVFQYPMFSLAAVITMVVNMALFSGFMLIPIYAQSVIGLTPMQSGLMLLPGAIINGLMSPVTGRLFDKLGGRILAVTGLSILTITTYFFSKLTFDTTFTHVAILHIFRMFGMSMVMMPTSTNGLNQLPPRLYPHGTAMNNTFNQVSAAIGTAFLITVMSNRQESHAEELMKAAMTKAHGALTPEQIGHIQIEALLEGINHTFLVSTFIIVIALVLAFFIKRARPIEEKDRKQNDQSFREAVAEN